MLQRDYNIAYTRKRFLKPMLGKDDLRELAELEKICFPPPENYDMRTLRMFVSLNGAGLLRWREDICGQPRLVAFHLFDCLAAELITLDVHPDFRRRGIAAALLAESLSRLRQLGHKYASCQIATDNDPSLQLHERFGFRRMQILRKYYENGRDAYLLRAPLDKPLTLPAVH